MRFADPEGETAAREGRGVRGAARPRFAGRPGRALAGFVLLALILTVAPRAFAAPPPSPTVASTVLLTGPFTHLLMDPFRDRLYLADSYGSVVVWNTTTEKEMANVTVGAGPYGMDVSLNATELYVALTGSTGLAVVNLSALKLSRVIPLGVTPYDVAAGRTGRAYVTTNEYTGYPRIVDTIRGQVIGSVTSGGTVFQNALVRSSMDRSSLYLGDDYVGPADTRRYSITSDAVPYVSQVPFNSLSENLQDMLVSDDGSRLFLTFIGTVNAYASYSIEGLYTSNWSTLGIWSVGPYPNSVAIDQRAQYVFGSNTGTGVVAFNAATGTTLATLTFSQGVNRIRSTPDGTKLYALTSGRLEVVATGLAASSRDPPYALATASAVGGYVPLNVAFTGTAVLGVAPYTYAWTFGDGGTSSLASPTHLYSNAGTFNVTLTVHDAASYAATAALQVTTAARPLPNSLDVVLRIPGISYNPNTNNWAPPDPQVAAGPLHVVELVNLRYEIWTKNAAIVATGTSATFFQANPSDSLTDPKITFDAASQRWFATIDDLTLSSVLLAVSTTSNPLDPWTVRPFLSASACPDQPLLGVGTLALGLSANDFTTCTTTGVFVGAEYWVINKTQLLAGTAPAYAHYGPVPSRGSLHPIDSLGPTTTLYFASVGWALVPTTGLLVYRVSGVPPGPVTVQQSNLTVRTINQPPNSPQPVTSLTVNTGDARVQDGFWEAGSLWVALGDACNVLGANQSCVRLIEVNTTTLAVVQDFDTGNQTDGYFYPAIRPDGAGNLDVVFGYSSATDYPGIRAATQLATDAPNALRAPVLLQTGLGAEALACDTSTCRYGDYFGASRDPANPSVVWTVGEYGGTAGWQTLVAEIGTFRPVNVTLSYTVAGGGTGYTAPRVTFYQGGTAVSAFLSLSPQTFAMDAGSIWSVPTTLPGSSAAERWAVTGVSQGLVAGPGSTRLTYDHQFRLAVIASPAAGGTAAPTSGWYNANASVALYANATAGWTLHAWVGVGSASYSGPATTQSVSLVGPVNETAVFYPGLTVTVGPGGSVYYSYGAQTGTIPSGSTVTLFVPYGSNVTLTSAAGPLNAFSGWSGALTGSGPVGLVQVNGPASVTALFGLSSTSILAFVGLPLAVVVVILVVLLARRQRKKPGMLPPPPPTVPPPMMPPPQTPPGAEGPSPPAPPPPGPG